MVFNIPLPWFIRFSFFFRFLCIKISDNFPLIYTIIIKLQSFRNLSVTSPCDHVYLEMRLALELKVRTVLVYLMPYTAFNLRITPMKYRIMKIYQFLTFVTFFCKWIYLKYSSSDFRHLISKSINKSCKKNFSSFLSLPFFSFSLNWLLSTRCPSLFFSFHLLFLLTSSYVCLYLFINLLAYLFIYLFVCLFNYLTIYLFICSFVYLII